MNNLFRRVVTLLSLVLISLPLIFAQTYKYQPYRVGVRPVKNVIVMIPDGTSIGVVSAARWYKYYNGAGAVLNIDPYICGTVKTHSSNAPIGDSAPTTSAYMTGMPQQTANVSIYPLADPANDLVEVDPTMAYQPLATVLEAAKIEKNKAVGLVVTCEFPHATPADCSAHYPRRSNYNVISSQMAYQNLDVMFGGGVSIITDDIKSHFANKGITYLANDLDGFHNLKTGKAWALFKDRELPYDLDRDPGEVPSIEEMTRKAIELLSQNDNGFFLMVEGSKVDWAAHSNDAIGCMTEYLAFDRAVGAAIEFAKKDGNTAVVILPDHGNSGFTLGRRDLRGYDKATIDQLFANVSKYKNTAEGIENALLQERPENVKGVVKSYTGIDITDEELTKLLSARNYHPENYMKVGESPNMLATLVEIMNARTYFGFTTGGHTAEEVFLAVYHPSGDIPVGMNTNIEINRYLQDLVGFQTKLPDLTKRIFAKHTDIFTDVAYKVTIDKSTSEEFPILIIRNGKKTLEVPAFKSVAYLNKEPFDLGSVVVYIQDNDTFYLPQMLIDKIK